LQRKDGSESWVHMTNDEILDHRDKYSKSAKRPGSPWLAFPTQMAKKTVLKELLKLEKLSPEQQSAVVMDERRIDLQTEKPDDKPYADFGEVIDINYDSATADDGDMGDRE